MNECKFQKTFYVDGVAAAPSLRKLHSALTTLANDVGVMIARGAQVVEHNTSYWVVGTNDPVLASDLQMVDVAAQAAIDATHDQASRKALEAIYVKVEAAIKAAGHKNVRVDYSAYYSIAMQVMVMVTSIFLM